MVIMEGGYYFIKRFMLIMTIGISIVLPTTILGGGGHVKVPSLKQGGCRTPSSVLTMIYI